MKRIPKVGHPVIYVNSVEFAAKLRTMRSEGVSYTDQCKKLFDYFNRKIIISSLYVKKLGDTFHAAGYTYWPQKWYTFQTVEERRQRSDFFERAHYVKNLRVPFEIKYAFAPFTHFYFKKSSELRRYIRWACCESIALQIISKLEAHEDRCRDFNWTHYDEFDSDYVDDCDIPQDNADDTSFALPG